MFRIIKKVNPFLIKSSHKINIQPIIVTNKIKQLSTIEVSTRLNEFNVIKKLGKFDNLNIEIKRCGDDDEDDDYGSGNSNGGGHDDKDDDNTPSAPTPNSKLDPLNPSNPLSPLNPMHPLHDDDSDSRHHNNKKKNEPVAAKLFSQPRSLQENIRLLANQEIKPVRGFKI